MRQSPLDVLGAALSKAEGSSAGSGPRVRLAAALLAAVCLGAGWHALASPQAARRPASEPALASPGMQSERQGVIPQRSQAPAQPSTGTATVTVNVVAVDDGTAVKGARVSLLAMPTPAAAGPSGRPGIQPQAIAPRDVKLSRGGILTGRVFDEDGDPITWAQISVYRVPRLGGRPQQAFGGGSQPTNDLGVYRVWGLQAGDYIVSASYDDGQSESPETAPGDGYVPTYYPSVAAFDQARAVSVRPGQETGAADVRMARGRLGTVLVRVLDAAGSLAGLPGGDGVGAHLTPRGNNPTRQSLQTMSPEGFYVVSRVPAGDYYLSAVVMRESGRDYVIEKAYVPVRVNGDETSVTLQTNFGATVSGRVVVEGVPPAQAASPGPGGRPPSIRVMTQSASAAEAPAFSNGKPAEVRPDGTFTLTGVRGPVQFTASGGRAALKSVRRGMDEITGRPIELFGTERIDDLVITMTYDTGMLRGEVLVDGSEPTSTASVLVLPDDPEKWNPGSPFVRWSRSASAGSAARGSSVGTPGTAAMGQPAGLNLGSFQVSGLLPGRYLVLAFADDNTFSNPDPQSVERLRELGKVVTVDVGQTATVKVEATKWAR